MKKAIFLCCFVFTFFFGFGQGYFNPLSAIARADAEGTILSRQLAFQISSEAKPYLLAGEVLTNIPGVYQKFVVFSHQGKRVSVYYQWQADRDGALLKENEFISIYVRPEGTQDPDNLEYYKDYLLNGTWDEFSSGRCLYLAESEESESFDSVTQGQYISALKFVLSYFN